MRQEIATEWTKLLRSGEFKQGRAALQRADNTFCCLGVLCEMAVRENVIPAPVIDDYPAHFSYGLPGENSSTFLPEQVREWAGMDDDCESQMLLANKNDGGSTFTELADLIDAEYETL